MLRPRYALAAEARPRMILADEQLTNGDMFVMLGVVIASACAGVLVGRWWALLVPGAALGAVVAMMFNDDWYSRVPETRQAALAFGSVVGFATATIGVVFRARRAASRRRRA